MTTKLKTRRKMTKKTYWIDKKVFTLSSSGKVGAVRVIVFSRKPYYVQGFTAVHITPKRRRKL